MKIRTFEPETIDNAQEMKKYLQIRYFHTICTIRKTDNFHVTAVDFFLEDQKEGDDVILLGSVTALEGLEIEGVQCIKATFVTTYDEKEKYILMHRSDYKDKFIKYFNRMISKKNDKYIFTGLKMDIFQDKVVFLLQPLSQLLLIQDQVYTKDLKPIERIFDFKYSNINLAKVYTLDEMNLTCRDGFLMKQIKQKFQTLKKQPISIVGAIEILEDKFEKSSLTRCTLELMVTQTLFETRSCNELGKCKIIVRYLNSQKQKILNFFVNNHVYFFADPDLIITDNVNIVFKININSSLKNYCIFKITPDDESVASTDWHAGSFQSNFQYYLPNLKISLKNTQIADLLQKKINRNYIKVHLNILEIQYIYGIIRCTKCRAEQREVIEAQKLKQEMEVDETTKKSPYSEFQDSCSHSLGLELWGIVRATDTSGTCLLSMEHRQIVTFLELSEYLPTIYEQIQNNGKGIIFNSKQTKSKQLFKNEHLSEVKTFLKYNFVEKHVIGYAWTELQKTFREGLSENEQMEYQTSFQTTKKYLMHHKIFPNGIIEKRDDQLYMVPFIKAVAVLQSE